MSDTGLADRLRDIGLLLDLRYVRWEASTEFHVARVGVGEAFCGAPATNRPRMRLMTVPPRGRQYHLCRSCEAGLYRELAKQAVPEEKDR